MKRNNYLHCLLLVITTLCMTALQAAEVQWISAVGGDWNDTANWSGSVLPTESDDVLISIAADSTIEHSSANTVVNSLTLTGNLNLLSGSLTVAGASEITGLLTIQQGATLIATGEAGSLIVNGLANIDGGNVHALNGGQISLPGATRYQGAGSLIAQGTGSRLDLSALTDIGIGTPGTTDITEAFSRAVSVYHRPLSEPEVGPDLGINQAYSRAIAVYHRPFSPVEDGPALGINEAYSRAVSIYHKPFSLEEDGPELGVTEAFSRSVSVYHKPFSPAEDGSALGISEAYSRSVSIYHKPYMPAEDGPALGISEAFSRQIMIENVITDP